MQHWNWTMVTGLLAVAVLFYKKFTKINFKKYVLKIMGLFLTEVEDKGICKKYFVSLIPLKRYVAT
jgi:hypothetical protein